MKTFFKLFSLALVFFYSCNNVDLENISGIDFIPSESYTILNINDLDTTKEIFQSNPLIPNIYSELEIISSLIQNKKDMTIVMVAHRLTTLKACKKIFYLDQGKLIKTFNSYDELNNQLKNVIS